MQMVMPQDLEESDIALRTEPKLSLPTARSIIAMQLVILTN